MKTILREVGGRNAGRTLTFTDQEKLVTGLKSLVISRFRSSKSIQIEELPESQMCYVLMGETRHDFAELTSVEAPDPNEW